MGGTKAKVPPAAEFDLLHPCDGKCLGDGTDAVPSNNPGHPIYLRMTMGKNFNDRPDSIKIEIRDGGDGGGQYKYKNYAGLQLKKHARTARRPIELFISTHSMERPETICFISPEYNSDFSGSTNCTNIYATRPRFDGQLPVSDSDGTSATVSTEEQSLPRFLWAKITGPPKKGAYYAKALAGSSIMEVAEDERVMERGEHAEENSILYKSEEALRGLGPRTMVWKGEKAAGLFHISTDTILDMKISPGIDPCLMIALGVHMMNRLHVLDRETANNELLEECCCCFCPC